jgi:sec-independent protein translocase protein TatB
MGFGFSGEMIFIFFLALILFGPKKMPEIGRQVARFLGEFRRASYEFRSQIESEINSLDRTTNDRSTNATGKPQILPPLQAPLGSLASRIFNPPSAEKPEVPAPPVPETSAASVSAEPVAVVEPQAAAEPPSDTSSPKAAPDA